MKFVIFLVALLFLGIAGYASATHEFVTEQHVVDTNESHTYTDTVNIVSKGKTTPVVITGTLSDRDVYTVTDTDPLQHPVTVTETVGGTTTTTPPTTTTTPPTTTTTPPPSGSVPELIWPRNALSLGDAPERACLDPSPSAGCAAFNDMNRSDYEGWSALNGNNERMQFVPDPGLSGKVVTQFEVFGNDSADQYGGTRTSLWREPDNCSGCEAWQVMGFYIPVGFQYPDGWFLLYQMFYPGGGSPPIALELRQHNGGALRNHLYWSNRNAAGNVVLTPLGQVQEGAWHYVVQNVKFSSTDGFDKVWLGYNSLPNTSEAPLVNYSGQTLYGTSAGRTNPMLYRAASTSSQHQVVYYCGIHRASTLADASQLANCPTNQTPPPPQPTGDEPPSGTVIKTVDSTNVDVVGGSASNDCLINRGSLGDVFTGGTASVRCTWLETDFLRSFQRHVFDVSMRFDALATESTSWEQEIMFRADPPGGEPLQNSNCASGGNAETLPIRLWVDRAPSPDVWKLDLRGGQSFWLADQTITVLDLGPRVVGQTLKLAFDVTFHPEHGSVRVWKNDTLVYKNLDRPFGFRQDCTRSYDISGYPQHVQHGVYRGGSGAYTFSSSGFRFYQ